MTIDMTISIAACLSAFGLGYSAGSLIRIVRRAFESIE